MDKKTTMAETVTWILRVSLINRIGEKLRMAVRPTSLKWER